MAKRKLAAAASRRRRLSTTRGRGEHQRRLDTKHFVPGDTPEPISPSETYHGRRYLHPITAKVVKLDDVVVVHGTTPQGELGVGGYRGDSAAVAFDLAGLRVGDSACSFVGRVEFAIGFA
ncbi:hypothetical protein PIB30_058985 [Stylosanthes scabra]|uniref:Uncharacterized protein n=1 Tax=Stylosanthes scabra TaxID=79078 RepID=A0ABU6ULS4_9FABA|nr:hypothetical protein [Stylosanthes scabra]